MGIRIIGYTGSLVTQVQMSSQVFTATSSPTQDHSEMTSLPDLKDVTSPDLNDTRPCCHRMKPVHTVRARAASTLDEVTEVTTSRNVTVPIPTHCPDRMIMRLTLEV